MLIRMELVRVIVLDEDKSSATHVQADIRLPAGTPFETTAAAAERFADAARGVNETLGGTAVHSISVVVGGMTPSRLDDARCGISNDSHLASVRIHLNARPARTASLGQIERMWREGVGDTSFSGEARDSDDDASITGRTSPMHSSTTTSRVLRTAAAEFRAHLEAVPGLYEFSDSLSLGKRHFEVHLTPAGVAAGLTLGGISAQLRANYHGVEDPADPARPRRNQGHAEVPGGTAPESERAFHGAHSPPRRRRGAPVHGRAPDGETGACPADSN